MAIAKGGATMSNIKILSPKVDEYILVVSVPLESSIHVERWNIIDAEKFFISKVKNESNHDKKVEFDRARALLKWASCYNSRLVDIHSSNHKLKVSLGFSSLESMIDFRDAMSESVSDAAMK